MSLFRPLAVTCPACEESFEFDAVESVNADRRPDLREAILNHSFQVIGCPKCEERFRLDPAFNYLDVAGGQWISVQPLEELPDWVENEDEAVATFSLAYGDQAPDPAREIGHTLRPRLVFGWSALREKLVAGENKIDDVALELLKLTLIQSLDRSPLAAGNELRLEAVEGDELEFLWVKAETGEAIEALRVPREMYDAIVNDPEAWAEVRQKLDSGPFIDMQKLYLGAGRPVAA